jgi:ABC-type Na+ efflux pump permease subunit
MDNQQKILHRSNKALIIIIIAAILVIFIITISLLMAKNSLPKNYKMTDNKNDNQATENISNTDSNEASLTQAILTRLAEEQKNNAEQTTENISNANSNEAALTQAIKARLVEAQKATLNNK